MNYVKLMFTFKVNNITLFWILAVFKWLCHHETKLSTLGPAIKQLILCQYFWDTNCRFGR